MPAHFCLCTCLNCIDLQAKLLAEIFLSLVPRSCCRCRQCCWPTPCIQQTWHRCFSLSCLFSGPPSASLLQQEFMHLLMPKSTLVCDLSIFSSVWIVTIAAKLAVINIPQDAALATSNLGILTINIIFSNTVLISVSVLCHVLTIQVAGNLVPDLARVKRMGRGLTETPSKE